MRGELPAGLPATIRDAARIMIEAARREGWRVEEEVLADGKLSISASSPDGNGFCFASGETEFVERLRAGLMKTRSPK
jgi:hypothetical protein